MTNRQMALLCATLFACAKAIAFTSATQSDRLLRDADNLVAWLDLKPRADG